MLRLHKSSLHNQRLYLNVHLQPWKRLVSCHKDHVVAHRYTWAHSVRPNHQADLRSRTRFLTRTLPLSQGDQSMESDYL
jgi:hypothetical protein